MKKLENVKFDNGYFVEHHENIQSHYYNEVFDCIVDYINENFETLEDLPNYFADFADEIILEDSITGGASGSYFYNRWKAYDSIFNGKNDSVSYDESYALLAHFLETVYGYEEGGRILIDSLECGNFEELDSIIRQELVYSVCNYIYDQLDLN